MKHIIALFLAFVLVSCSNKTGESNEEKSTTEENTVSLTEAQIKSAGIKTANGEKKNISAVLKVNGKIEVPPQNIVSISVPLGGYLKSTHLLPGTKIKKGENIATFEDQQYIQIQQDYLTSEHKDK